MEYHQFVQFLKASKNSDDFLANLIKKVGAKYEALYSKENLSNCSSFLASLTGPERGIDAETSSVLINVLPGYLSNFQDSSELTSVKESLKNATEKAKPEIPGPEKTDLPAPPKPALPKPHHIDLSGQSAATKEEREKFDKEAERLRKLKSLFSKGIERG